MATKASTKVYFRTQAPYLQSFSQSENVTTENVKIPSTQEADAAAGSSPLRRSSIQHQLSSIGDSSLARTPSMLWRNRSRKSLGEEEEVINVADTSMALSEESNEDEAQKIEPDWRLRDRMKTVGVGLVLAVNIGTDPPDIVKPHPCAVLQCWMNPHTVSRAKAKEIIGERLEQQYSKWQQTKSNSSGANRQFRHRRAIDPTVDDVRNLCKSLRRQARNERVLLHYNGHGVPRPTDHGEIWVFDKGHTEYIPLPVTDVRQWMGKPAIVVLDCSWAGILLPFLTKPLDDGLETDPSRQAAANSRSSNTLEDVANQWVKDTIVLAPCDVGELLPMDPAYPADVFTACLTTPIKMALHWFLQRNPMDGIDTSMVDKIPGKSSDRKTPLGELNWIFIAVTDSVAWNVLPKYLFQRLFRQDLLVASLFRNFLLADRILRHLGCTPVSCPALPSTAEHPLWQAWDLACETLLFQLVQHGVFEEAGPTKKKRGDDSDDDSHASPKEPVPVEIIPKPIVLSVSSPFFSEQLTAFEVWLDFAAIHNINLATGKLQRSPEQLPVVLQVLLSQVHRIRALTLLRRFLDLGPWAVNLALSLGIFPYVMKLLQSSEYKSLLVRIWASILSFDSSCRVDLRKDGSFHHFVQHLMWGLKNGNTVDVASAAKERTLAAYILAIACHEYPAGQAETVRLNLHLNCCALLSSYEQGERNQTDGTVEVHLPYHFRLWIVLCLGSMVIGNPPLQIDAYSSSVHQRLAARIFDQNSMVRAAACFAFGCLIGRSPSKGSPSRSSSMQDIAGLVRQQMGGQPSGMLAPQPNPIMAAQSMPGMGMSTAVTLTTTLQPSFTPRLPANISLGQAPPNQVPQVQLIPQHGSVSRQAQPGMSTPGNQGGPPQAFWNHAAPNMRPALSQPVGQMQFSQVPNTALATMASPTGFLPFDAAPFQPAPFPVEQVPRQKPSVFDDLQRVEFDLYSIDKLIECTKDASVIVRCEAVIGLASAVDKYLDAFVAIASSSLADSVEADPTESVNEDIVDRFRPAWARLRELQRVEVFPLVARAVKDTVSFVHEYVLHFRESEGDHTNSISRPSDAAPSQVLAEQLASGLANIDEDDDSSALPSAPSTIAGPGAGSRANPLRRVYSEMIPSNHDVDSSLSLASQNKEGTDKNFPCSYTLPQSEFCQWQISSFDHNFTGHSDDDADADPLSPEGTSRLHQACRTREIAEDGKRLAEHFASLAPKVAVQERREIDRIFDEEFEETAAAAEKEMNEKKHELSFKELLMLRHDGVDKRTSLLAFHPYEDLLVSGDGSDRLSTWNTNTGKRVTMLRNCNPAGTRMTSCCWINEQTSKSMVLIGSDDGAVRLWGGLIPSVSEPSPSTHLVSAFQALPMSQSNTNNFVCEWQSYRGRLITAGCSQHLRCWDLESERVVVQLETETSANITTVTTAYDPYSSTSASVLGPDVLVAGQSDGSLRIFDLRVGSTAGAGSRPRRSAPRATQYSEHKSWVMHTAFTHYHSSKYEIVSGTLSGELKFWDLRLSQSIRTVEAQRKTLTTLAVHTHIPIIATGSDAQFVKLLTPDGDLLQVLRYHEKRINLGPVSCVAFHPHKPMLAVGAAFSTIGLYTPKTSVY